MAIFQERFISLCNGRDSLLNDLLTARIAVQNVRAHVRYGAAARDSRTQSIAARKSSVPRSKEIGRKILRRLTAQSWLPALP